MKEFGQALGLALWGVLRLAFALAMVTGKVTAMLTVPLAARAVRWLSGEGRPARAKPQEVARIGVQLPQAEVISDTGPATVIVQSEFEVADRIVSIRLEPPVGVINLRVYKELGLVKRDLIVSEPCLRAIMRGRRHSLPELPYDRLVGLEQIKDETIEAVEKLINEVGNRAVRANRRRKDDFVRTKPAAVPATAVAAVAKEAQALPAPAVQATSKAEPPMTAVVAPKVTTGFTYVGELVKAGSETIRPKGRSPYEVFEATLQLDNGAELALRGAELERELTANGCHVGQRVAITPMGKVPVTLASGEEGSKNLYRVRRMDALSKG